MNEIGGSEKKLSDVIKVANIVPEEYQNEAGGNLLLQHDTTTSDGNRVLIVVMYVSKGVTAFGSWVNSSWVMETYWPGISNYTIGVGYSRLGYSPR